ncbi:LacI family DNA-binding transcriptional regulator [Modestobacter roseus]|uniref:LacI family transcriptional regulator n=1 Tax=Modestobacter roseus TaxID=1181884 RepID=A0A562IPI2_9ACTN|nr:LacI family DNA-binding transcriptional regulator [Modestobacter roseus]MQA35395.1 substrate-binding domain-containing protein [Modestobacter roseus]TWH72790.1 LacI family transcriptional regulator [Modestobacter roseus]
MAPDTPRHAPTIRDVARVAQVSVTTVSHALSAKRPVSREAVERIQAAIEHLGYVPSSAARTLQRGRTGMLGLVVPDVSDPFFGRLAVSVERAADAEGYGVVLSSSGVAPGRDVRHFDLLRSRSIDGLVYVAGEVRREDELQRLAGAYPIVLADESSPALAGLPFVGADHAEGGRLVGRYLDGLGHTDVAVVTGPRGLRSAEERVAGFGEVLPGAAVIDGDFTERVAAERTAALLARGRVPTAVFACNDVMALGVIDAVRAAGLSVPADVSVVGFDDVPLAHRVVPGLTTVRQPIDEVGRLATEVLIRLMAGEDPDPPSPLPVELVERGTVAAPRATEPAR